MIERVVDGDSFFEIKQLFAGELITGLARIDGCAVGVVANQPKVKGGVLFVDSADIAARSAVHADQETTQLAAKVRHDVAAFDSHAAAGLVSLHLMVDFVLVIRLVIKSLNL